MGVSFDNQPIQHVLPADDSNCVMPLEGLLRQEMRLYAVELRKLAYTIPDGAGEQALLRLAQHMTITADQPLACWRARRHPDGSNEPDNR